MRMNLVLELLDVPGQLVSVLEPISGLGANLVTVIHKRDFKNENGMVPVQLTLEGEQESLNNVVNRFEDLGFLYYNEMTCIFYTFSFLWGIWAEK